jgi:hypothetical protein
MTALSYIQSKGFEYKNQSGQVVLRECPFCGDTEYHFYLDPGEDGPYFCHKCNERGNLITLKKHFGDYEMQGSNRNTFRKPQHGIKQAFPSPVKGKVLDEQIALQAHERFLKDEEAVRYLTEERKINLETAKTFKLGVEIDRAGIKWLTIPHYSKEKLVNVKYRSLPPAEKTFKRVEGCPSILFNEDAIEGAEEFFITEGEIDCLTLWDRGIKNVVGVTTGAGSFSPAWIDQLSRIKKIYLVYDQDEVGQKGVREVARRLGYKRCFNILLPKGQDVNDFFQEHDIFEFQTLINGARQFDIAGIISLEEGLDRFSSEYSKPEQKTGLLTGLKPVDRIIKTGLQAGDLIVISAIPKVGKTSFSLQVVTFNAFQDIPSLFFCLEMRPMKIIQKIIQSETRKEDIGTWEIEKVKRAFQGKPLYLGYSYQRPDLNGIIETLKLAVRRYGLKLLVFDHLHFLCRSIHNQVQEVGLAVQAFKFLAEEMEIPVILIAQPRKIQGDNIMTAMDLKDSSSIFSDCDHLIILHRERLASTGKEIKEGMQTHDQAYDPITLVRVEASRYSAGGETLLYFHGEHSRFEEFEKKN